MRHLLTAALLMVSSTALAQTYGPAEAPPAEPTCQPAPEINVTCNCNCGPQAAAPVPPAAYAPPPVVYTPPPPPPEQWPPPPVVRSLRDSTHNWILPNGNNVPAGDAEVSLHEGVLLTANVGVSDSFEIDLTMPLIPVFAGLGAKVQLLPRSGNLRLAIGGDVWVPLMSDEEFDPVFSGTATVGYLTDRFEIHGSATLIAVSGTQDDGVPYALSAGMSFMLGNKVALFGEIGQLGESDVEDSLAFGGAGLKFMGNGVDVDAGFFKLMDLVDSGCDESGCSDSEESPPLPMVTVHWRM